MHVAWPIMIRIFNLFPTNLTGKQQQQQLMGIIGWRIIVNLSRRIFTSWWWCRIIITTMLWKPWFLASFVAINEARYNYEVYVKELAFSVKWWAEMNYFCGTFLRPTLPHGSVLPDRLCSLRNKRTKDIFFFIVKQVWEELKEMMFTAVSTMGVLDDAKQLL